MVKTARFITRKIRTKNMGTIHEVEKLKFYYELRKDEFVQDLKAEEKIRDITEKILEYIDQAELAEDHLNKHKSEDKYYESTYYSLKLDDGRYIAINATRTDSLIPLDFQDIKEIAYHAGTYKDYRNFAAKVLRTEHSLQPRFDRCFSGYESFRDKQILDRYDIEEDIISFLHSHHLDARYGKELGLSSLEEVANKCCNYINRGGKLVRLFCSTAKIFKYYDDKAWECLIGGVEEGKKLTFFEKLKIVHKNEPDMEGLSLFKEEKMKNKEVKEIAEYLKKQAGINYASFKTIFLAFLRTKIKSEAFNKDLPFAEKVFKSIGQENKSFTSPEELTEDVYKTFLPSDKSSILIANFRITEKYPYLYDLNLKNTDPTL